MLKKKTSTRIDEAVAKSINFELTVASIARRSERRAWWVAFSAIGMSLILAGGYFYMLPLKEKVPYIVMADAYTGTSSVARLTNDFLNQRITTSEAINRSNIAHFVLARESYDSAMINLHDWTTVLTMAAPHVASAYTHLYANNNEASPYKVYGRDRAIRVKILSIVLSDATNSAPRGATVRFQRSVYDKRTGASHSLDSKIATLTFTYKPNLKMDDQYRIENPLGFQVSEYRVDNDYASSPPDEEAGTPASDADLQGQSPAAAGSEPDGSAGQALRPSAMPQSPASESEPPAPREAASAEAPRNARQGARG
jgi:type IV secretion system protein VirB8